jgi:hypothetical protein
MKSNSRRPWVPPSMTKVAIGTQTKSAIAVDQRPEPGRSDPGTYSATEPRSPRAPATKFGFSLEWSFPLSVRTD